MGELEKKLEDTASGYWRLYYDPLTCESGLEWHFVPVVIFSKPVFIGTMPIRTDVKVKYADLDVPGFHIWERAQARIIGL